MKTMNYSLVRILFALLIGLVLANLAASYIVITVGCLFDSRCYQPFQLFRT